MVNMYSFFKNADEIPTECSGINSREYVSYAYSLRSLYLEDPMNQHLLLCASLSSYLEGPVQEGLTSPVVMVGGFFLFLVFFIC